MKTTTSSAPRPPAEHPSYHPSHEPMEGFYYLEEPFTLQKGDEWHVRAEHDDGSDKWEPIPDGMVGRAMVRPDRRLCVFRRPATNRSLAPEGAPFISTLKGSRINLSNPDPASFDIYEIAHALSQVCRHSGQSENFYSVAEHSVYVSHLVRKTLPLDYRAQLAGLLHDASESVMGDVPSPVKKMCPDYKKLEGVITNAVRRRFGLQIFEDSPLTPGGIHPVVEQADKMMFEVEFPQVFVWARPADPADLPALRLQFLPSKQAERLFLDRYITITKNLK